MRMSDPDLLVSELRSVSALRLDAIIVSNDLAALHHETRDDALEYSITEMQIESKLTCAESTEVFDSSGHLLLKEFHYNAALLIALLSFISYLDVHKNLNVSHVKLRHPTVDLRFSLAILAIHEYLGCCIPYCFIFATNCFIYLFLAQLPMLSNSLIVLLKLKSLSTVCESFGEVIKLKVGKASQVQSLSRIDDVHPESGCARFNRSEPVAFL